MTLDEQIEYTEKEYEAYSSSEFTCPEIVEWLKGVLESLYRLKSLEK
jgi:hypothetical protein